MPQSRGTSRSQHLDARMCLAHTCLGYRKSPCLCLRDINYTAKKRSKWVRAKVTSTREPVAVVHDHRPPQADSASFCVIRGQLPKEQSNTAANYPHSPEDLP